MNVFLIIGGLVALVWGTYFALRGSLLAGCCAYLVTVSCFSPFFLSFDVAGISLSIDRLFIVGLVVAFVVQWRLGRTEFKPLTKVDYALGAFFTLLFVSTFTHNWHASPGGVPIVQHLINGYLIPLAIYWIARQATYNERTVTIPLAALTCFGVYLGVTGLLEAAGQWSLVFPRYIADPDLSIHFGRARGPMVHSVSFGVYLCACLVAAWLWRERLSKRWQFAILLLIPILMAAIYFTKTRSVWLGGASAIFVVLALSLRGRVRMAVLGGMVACGLLVVALKYDSLLAFKREGTVADTRQSADMRMSFTYVSWKMFQDKPLFGFGFGHFADEKMPYLTDRSVDLRLESIRKYVHHNTFLSVLTELGLAGLVLYLFILASWGMAALRLVQNADSPDHVRRHGLLTLAVLAIAFWQMVGHEITFTPLEHSLIFLVAGMTVGLRMQSAPAKRRNVDIVISRRVARAGG